MKRASAVLLVFSAALGAAGARHTRGDPRVTLDSGTLAGTRFGAAGGMFLGIPYAAPPIGDLRWRPPQAPAGWTGVRAATAYGAACPQRPSPWLPEMLGRLQMATSEDCLFLNVWTPRLPGERVGARSSASPEFPVMVWIHGGGNVEGSQEWPPLGPALAERGVVVVTLNYRLGVLGYLSLPALSAESPRHASGNYGLLDQMAAIAWVQRNISRFGGDPHRITVFGASSGSLDICDLMASPLAKGLFQGAILQSGFCVDSSVPRLARAESQGAHLAESMGMRATDLQALRRVPAEKLVRAAAGDADLDLNPVLDDWVLREQPGRVFAEGRQLTIPVVAGSNTDEVSIFASPLVGGTSYRPKTVAEYRAWLTREFHADADAVFNAYPARTDAEVPAAFLAMDTDYEFRFGAELLAREVAASGQHAYLYAFTNVGKDAFAALGAFHSEESMVLSRHYWTTWRRRPADERLANAMIGYWTAFARRGAPSAPGLPAWPAYTPTKNNAQELGAHIGQTANPRAEQMRVFEKIAENELGR